MSVNMHGEQDIEELEEGEALVLPSRELVVIKTDVLYETNYTNLEELGKGKFGVVYKSERKEDGGMFAAKFVRKTTSSKEEVKREIEMMNLLHHKRLIQLYDAYETSKEMIVIMELVTGGELFEKVVEEDNLTEKQVIRYMKQVLYGVQHMHRRNMVHLDLKPENILCLGGGEPGYEQIKLIDFGMTRILKEGENETALCGTPEFVAPEVITFNPITVQADMWSLGVITYVLLSGLSPFMGDDDNETLANVTSGEFDFEDDDEIFENLSDESKQFIEKLLIVDPKQRLTIDQSLSHTWLTGGGSDQKINTSNLKKFIARRRWQRTMNTIKAVSRLAGGLSLFGKKPGAHGLGKGGFLEKVKQQQEKEEQEIKMKEEKAKISGDKIEKQKEKEDNEKKEKERSTAKSNEIISKQQMEANEDTAEIKQKGIECGSDPVEKNNLTDAERKRKRDEERQRRQDERKQKEDTKQVKVTGIKSTEPVKSIKNANDRKTTDDINDNNNNSSSETRNDRETINGRVKTKTSPLITKPTPKREPAKTGSVMNRIAAFQNGDAYWKNKK